MRTWKTSYMVEEQAILELIILQCYATLNMGYK